MGKPGEPYRPSNADAGEGFMGRFCYRCTREPEDAGKKGCPIIAYTMALDEDDKDYPKEWTYTEEGAPTCTAFDERQDGDTAVTNPHAVAKTQAAYNALPRDPVTGRPVI